jgi:hypothetical protein
MQELTRSDDLGFAKQVANKNEETNLIAASEAKAIAEVQAAYVIAKKFPRNEHEALMKILNACKRPFLAEQATYAYPKGGTLVSGPSIRLAEVLAQSWGNIEFGVKEISQSNGVSTVEAYAVDLETNTRKPVIFHVKHERHTKKGITRLTDPRDVYELVANQGARRLRNCILAVIPGDVQDAAIAQCKKTMETGEAPLADRIRMMVVKFDELGIKVEHLEKRLLHNLDATTPQEIVTLQGIYKSIKDGFASREDFFEIGIGKSGSSEADLDVLLADKKKHILVPDKAQKLDMKTGEVIKDAKG